jgi:hypothetical protein
MNGLSTFKRGKRRIVLTAAVAAMTLGLLVALIGASAASANGVALAKGDVLAGVGSAQVKNFSPSGTLQDTLTDTSGAAFTTGMCFDSSGNLYVTDFGTTMSKYDSGGNLLTSPFGSGYPSGHPESCTVDATNNIYVGGPGSPNIEKFDTSGSLLATFSVEGAPNTGGTDWVDLAADQCSLYYTGEGPVIKRFNVCKNEQEADFASGLPCNLAALRIRPNGEVMAACESSEVLRFDTSGKIVQTYPIAGATFLFAMNLDPDGTTFWTGDIGSGEIYHVDIATGTVINQFNSSPSTELAGLAVVGEIRAAASEITLAPLTAENAVGTTHTVTATVTEGGVAQQGVTVTFTVTGANPQTGTGTTNASGEATFTYTGKNAGTDTITASFVNKGGETRTSNQVTKKWTSADQAITASGTTVSATEGAKFSGTVATFNDPDTSATASEYSATIEWGDSTSSTGTVSGSGGSFAVSGEHTYAEEGSYTVKVTITDVDNSKNSATATSTANVADAALSSQCAATSTSTQAFAGPTATFTDADPNGMSPPDYSATINWGDSSSSSGTVSLGTGPGPYTVSGSHAYTSTGPFTITTTITDVGGSQTVATCKTLVFAFAPGGGSFVIGDKNSATGTHVLFWGAQWWKNNSLSGGSAPASFKGFAENPATPICKTGWSTDPGNSTPPPAGPLPEYMGVIVSSKITKSGSQISGDTPHIVVVKTDPGYQPNPGHAGTGTVVAQVC